MSKGLFYLGIDVGKDELVVVAPGRRPRPFATSKAGLRQLHRWAKKSAGAARMHFCMESTGVYSRSVAMRLLEQENLEISIINPAQIKAFGRAQLRRTKTDAVDAAVILAFAQSQQPPAWKPEPLVYRELSALVAHLDALQVELQRWQNRIHNASYDPDLPDFVKKERQCMVRFTQRRLEKTKAEIMQLINSNQQLNESVKLLGTIKGIGDLTAVRILSLGKNTITERSARALVAHAGLAPRERRSGTSLRKPAHIAKEGQRKVRRFLYMPALTAAHHNPVIAPFYQRLLNAGKPKQLALTACMKKLLLMARAILISKKPFQPQLIT